MLTGSVGLQKWAVVLPYTREVRVWQKEGAHPCMAVLGGGTLAAKSYSAGAEEAGS